MPFMLRILMLGLLLISPCVKAQTTVLPPVFFISTIDSTDFYNKLKGTPLFEKMDKENIGNPLKLIVTYNMEPTAGGEAAGLTSAILAGGSLGLLPMVTNNDLVLTYEFRVHNEVVASVSYRENFTKAHNMYSNEGLYSLDKDSLAWAMTTKDKFIEDIQKVPELSHLINEYNYYFVQ